MQELKEDFNEDCFGYITVRYTDKNYFLTALSLKNKILVSSSIGRLKLCNNKYELRSYDISRKFGLYFCLLLKRRGYSNYSFFIKYLSDFKGLNGRMTSLLTGFNQGNLNILGFIDSRPFAHNGVRFKKKRRQ